MSRQPHPTLDPEVLPGDVPNHALTMADEAAVRADDAEMAFEAAKTVGQIEALLFSATVAEKALVETFLKLKQNKAYRSIQFRDAEGNLRRIADLSEFCERYLKKSYRRVQEMASNYHLIGADLYEAAEQIGFRQKDYAAMKALPSDDQEVIKAAIAADDRDQVLDLLQEMAARHASEKAALTAKAKEASETAEARDTLVKTKQATVDRLEEENHKLKRRQADFTDIEKAGYECAPLHAAVAETIVGLAKIEREVARLMHEVGGAIVLEECVTAVLVAARRAVQINRECRLDIADATMLDIIDEDGRQALEFRALGVGQPEVGPEALQ
jgi:hypothetical protein